jgi:UDP-N-acetylmuramoyl-L-alanyl-D-glutamate--2,6-diaminopimelate ligase
VIGTLGNGMAGNIQPSNLTTPDAITLQATLANLLTQGAKAVAMEVSSHSIDQGRVKGIPFEVGIFTNLTRDHLDYHGDMTTYGNVKKRLFENPLLQVGVINADDVFGKHILETLSAQKTLFAYSTNQQENLTSPKVIAENIHLDITGMQAPRRGEQVSCKCH